MAASRVIIPFGLIAVLALALLLLVPKLEIQTMSGLQLATGGQGAIGMSELMFMDVSEVALQEQGKVAEAVLAVRPGTQLSGEMGHWPGKFLAKVTLNSISGQCIAHVSFKFQQGKKVQDIGKFEIPISCAVNDQITRDVIMQIIDNGASLMSGEAIRLLEQMALKLGQ